MNVQGWSDFEQFYDYEVQGYVTYTLVCTKDHPMSLKFFRDKINKYYSDIVVTQEKKKGKK